MAHSTQFYSTVLVTRLQSFASRIGEVPADSFQEMRDAVAEVSACVLRVTTGVEAADCHSRSPEENIALAVTALQERPILEEYKDCLQNIRVSVTELFEGLKAARVAK